jgi:hypothetical protein
MVSLDHIGSTDASIDEAVFPHDFRTEKIASDYHKEIAQ